MSTIKAVICPRTELEALGRRSEARKTGVYILAGDDLERLGRLRIYIGEGDEVFTRIRGHNNDESMEFWDRVLLFVSKDENLTKAHVRHLEAQLLDRARKANRCSIANRKDAIGGSLPEADLMDMAEFLAQVQLLASTLGLPAFEMPGNQGVGAEPRSGDALDTEVELVYRGIGFDARAAVSGGEFVVRKGSRARLAEAESFVEYGRAMRKTLIEAHVLRQDGDAYVFQQDYAFSSPTGAAQVIVGGVVNGRLAWKLADGRTYKEWQEAHVEAQAVGE